ncbi:hypothetical protein LSUB1_G007871 [Lachnellula subtilissima]|uniref:WW domain-containing protein n=1 Tax=Lachnellula subtilissima TaxID=602034 RepID=A0A8H8U4J2_9HELO|nr:hypothetical protein LSUB1_G007871 [Lachnellula subtilissima]
MTENAAPSPASGKPRDKSPRLDTDAPEQSTTAIESKGVPPTELEDGEYEEGSQDEPDKQNNSNAPPLPDEAPPLPSEAPPSDDGWAPIWEETAKAFYFYNRFTHATQWTNPRVPDITTNTTLPPPPGLSPAPAPETSQSPPPPAEAVITGYNPAIHGDYDPSAWYAQPSAPPPSAPQDPNSADPYAATAAFNRFTGRFQAPEISTDNFNDENNHDGRSLKAERSGKKLSKTELKTFKEKRKAKKEEKRRAWLRD